mmetsp:Transcript_36048/g.84330  ORF Transcript_36048/g.84330 Transcript_36048/m.84330 type:complete len:204 (-) Transcript_36048:380-991(-)
MSRRGALLCQGLLLLCFRLGLAIRRTGLSLSPPLPPSAGTLLWLLLPLVHVATTIVLSATSSAISFVLAVLLPLLAIHSSFLSALPDLGLPRAPVFSSTVSVLVGALAPAVPLWPNSIFALLPLALAFARAIEGPRVPVLLGTLQSTRLFSAPFAPPVVARRSRFWKALPDRDTGGVVVALPRLWIKSAITRQLCCDAGITTG